MKIDVHELTRLDLKPGEALAITMARTVTVDEAFRIKHQVSDALGCRVFVLAPGTTLSAVRCSPGEPDPGTTRPDREGGWS